MLVLEPPSFFLPQCVSQIPISRISYGAQSLPYSSLTLGIIRFEHDMGRMEGGEHMANI